MAKAKKQKVDHYPFGRAEGLALEFKRATRSLPSNFFETACAFLNMGGGLIVLGVEDDGFVSGVAHDAAVRIKALPIFEKYADVFVTTIPIVEVETGQPPKPGPEKTQQVTPQVTPQVVAVLRQAIAVSSASELLEVAGLKDRVHFLKSYLEPLLAAGWLERTIPDKPRSRLQKYRLTEKGRQVLKRHKET